MASPTLLLLFGPSYRFDEHLKSQLQIGATLPMSDPRLNPAAQRGKSVDEILSTRAKDVQDRDSISFVPSGTARRAKEQLTQNRLIKQPVATAKQILEYKAFYLSRRRWSGLRDEDSSTTPKEIQCNKRLTCIVLTSRAGIHLQGKQNLSCTSKTTKHRLLRPNRRRWKVIGNEIFQENLPQSIRIN